jgi:hypothetical protein
MTSPNLGKSKCRLWLLEHAAYDGDDCLIWPFNRCRGYGLFGHMGEMLYAHRFMCELVHGEAPSTTHHAAHTCGRGQDGCVNPKHLEWKTPSANQLDKRIHGGAYRGGRKRKLTVREVRVIRAMNGRATHDEMAQWFEISRRNVGAIVDGRTWKDVK